MKVCCKAKHMDASSFIVLRAAISCGMWPGRIPGAAVGLSILTGKTHTRSHEQLRLGTLTGFQYFSCYLRGREELLVTINREAPTAAGHPESPGQGGLSIAPSPRKPISPDPLGKPPASPASREITAASDTECVFLIGAYQRYKSPFVWLRSGHLDAYTGPRPPPLARLRILQ